MKKFGGLSMGGHWSAVLHPAADVERAQELVQGALDRIEETMSAWKPDSVLCHINAAPIGQWVALPKEIANVIGAGLGLMIEMQDVFSILLGGASAKHGFVPGEERQITGNIDAVEFDGQRLRRLEDVTLDLNAIAKGYAVDMAYETLCANGYNNFLIEVAGDIRCNGLRPGNIPWNVTMELPVPDRIIPALNIPLEGEAIATSGSYRRTNDAYSHLISPKTGLPLPADGNSVAVIADTAMQADGWATVMSILGQEAGLIEAEKRGLPVVFIERDLPHGFVERGSTAMGHRLESSWGRL